ncbi:MAG: class II glutamine amidotransferase [Alphaproteobacteria bacterium]|nr:class II glutamine amidotransferase [Alphaproteobacteria bacterium]
MCELFAMSCRWPATVTFSLSTLASHGGGGKPYADGWGVAFYDDRDAFVFREANTVYKSPLVDFVESHGPQSTLVISHLRRASSGLSSLANTHPFARPLGAHLHMFAHNGNLKDIFDLPKFSTGRHLPLGNTDSEWAFCALLARLEPIWANGSTPSPSSRRQVIAKFASDLKTLGSANFLYTDSEYLFAYSDRRRQENGRYVAPGLHILTRQCIGEPSDKRTGGVSVDSQAQTIFLVASVPLTNENWRPLGEGELLMVRQGEIYADSSPIPS